MKKLKIVIYINILVLFAILLISELVSKHLENKGLIDLWVVQNPNMYPKGYISKYLKYVKIPPFNYEKLVTNGLREVNKGRNTNKRPVVTIGCSYTYGTNLSNENQTFAAQISRVTGRTVYNRGVCGSGPQMVYRQLIDKNFKNQVPDAEYIIYTFLSNDHIKRQFLYSLCGLDYDKVTPKYKIKNNHLEEDSFIWQKLLFFSLGRKFLVLRQEKEYKNELKNNYPLFFRTMEECAKAVNKNYNNAKFVILEVAPPRIIKDDSKPLSKENIKRLEKMGIIYINAEELVGHDFDNVKKYRVIDGNHPNGLMWQEIVLKLSKKLNL